MKQTILLSSQYGDSPIHSLSSCLNLKTDHPVAMEDGVPPREEVIPSRILREIENRPRGYYWETPGFPMVSAFPFTRTLEVKMRGFGLKSQMRRFPWYIAVVVILLFQAVNVTTARAGGDGFIVVITPGDPDWDDVMCGGYCVMTEGRQLSMGPDCQSCYCDDCILCCTACTQYTDPTICVDRYGIGRTVDSCAIDQCGGAP